jgi:3',5'-cyclic AMP phosphodiesterase CpdA
MKIIHISDLHLSNGYYLPSLKENMREFINETNPDLLIITGDMTMEGHPHEYEEVKDYIDSLKCEAKLIVPGNHDARNVGYEIFQELFGPRNSVYRSGGVVVVGIDSSQPDLDEGHIGRSNYPFIADNLKSGELKILALHHHLIPIPFAGREQNIVTDAGDALQVITEIGTHIVLSGHKHIPWIWKLEETHFINAGTATSVRVKGRTEQSFHMLVIDGATYTVNRIYARDFRQERLIAITIRRPGDRENNR